MATTMFDSREPQLTPPQDDQPMFGNPALTRSIGRRRGRGWMIGVPLAVVALAAAGVAYYATGGENLLNQAASTEVAETSPAATAPVAAPAPAPAPTPEAQVAPPPAPAAAAAAHVTRHAAARHVRHAPSAGDDSADVSASVPAPTQPATPPAATESAPQN